MLGAVTLLVAALAVAAVLGIAGGDSPEARTTTTAERLGLSLAEGAELNDVGFARMEAGDYEGALPPLVRAVEALRGSGTLTEAYARYNLAFTRFALGHCSGVLTPLERSEAIQGQRDEIDELRSEWAARCAPPPPEDDGQRQGEGQGARPRRRRRRLAVASRAATRISSCSGKRPSACFEKSTRPSARTSNWPLPPGIAVAATPSFSVISPTRLAARVS